MIVGLPSGIGDVSWALSKLWAIRELIDCIEVADGWPYRTKPYVELTGLKCEYGAFDYQTICTNQHLAGLAPQPGKRLGATWNRALDSIGRNVGPKIRLLLEPNRHLEMGRPLADWLPDLPTEYHYPLNTTEQDAKRARELVAAAVDDSEFDDGMPLVGISCASYRGAEAWKTWGRTEWVDMLQRVIDIGWTPILLGGFWDDLTHAVACELHLPDIVGKTSVAEGVEVMRQLPAYIGYSSGLNVIRTVVDKPAMAMWPDFQAELRYSWAPPHMVESQRYVGMLWRPVNDIWPVAADFLRRCGDEETQARERQAVQDADGEAA